MSEPTTEGRWTTEPPTVPGWYWWMHTYASQPEVVLVFVDVDTRLLRVQCIRLKTTFPVSQGAFWYTIPIQDPPK